MRFYRTHAGEPPGLCRRHPLAHVIYRELEQVTAVPHPASRGALTAVLIVLITAADFKCSWPLSLH